MNLIEVMYGKELFDTANCSVQIFCVPCKVFNNFPVEMNIESAARKEEVPVQRQTFNGTHSAWSEDARADLGRWTKASYNVSDGMLIKVWVHKMAGFGQRIHNVSQLIAPRKDAAFREIKVALTGHSKARYRYATIKGRFDLISYEEAVKRGAKINSKFAYTFKPEDVARVMEVTIIEPEKAPAALIRERKVRKRSGETVVIQKKRSVRALDLNDE